MKMQPVTQELAGKVVQALGGHPVLKQVDARTLQDVAFQSMLIHYAPEEPLCAQGDKPETFFVVLRGRVTVVATPAEADDTYEIAWLKPPDLFGELDVLLDEPRRAGAFAADQALVLQVPGEMLRTLFERSPTFGMAMALALAGRLRDEAPRVPLPLVDLAANPPLADALALVPRAFIERQRVLPLRSQGDRLIVGFVDELNAHVIAGLRRLVPGMDIVPMRVTPDAFNHAVQELPTTGGPVLGGSAPAPEGGYPAAGGPALGAAPAGLPGRPLSGKPLSAPKMDALFRRMVAEGASDLHMCAGHRPRWRIDGEMREIAEGKVLGDAQVWDLMESGTPDRAKEHFLADNDADFAYSLPDVARFRCNLFRDQRGIGLVARTIPSKIMTFEQLGLPEGVRKMCDNPKGLVLVTGPTGSGKSTTLAAMIDYINRTKRCHIITLEDPIEFVHASQRSLVNQREVGAHTKSFARALRASLREDPDIILVGEMRDLETIGLALETANTGHLVFGTLHTATAISTIDRVIDVFPHEQQSQVRAVLSETLKGVVAQTLVKKKGGGRCAALEVLVGSHAVSNLIREGKNHQIFNIMLTAKAQGNQLLNEQLERLVTDGKVEFDEALAKALDKADLSKRFGKDYFEK